MLMETLLNENKIVISNEIKNIVENI